MMRALPTQEDAEQAQQLRRFLRPLAAVLLFFGLFNVTVSAFVTKNAQGGIVGVLLLLYFATTFLARRLVDQGRTNVAASIIAHGALVVVLCASMLVPLPPATTAISALVAVAIALPYLDGARLRLVLVAAYAVVVLIVAKGFRPDPSAGLPFGIEFYAVLGGAASALYLLLLLLWQFTVRLRQTVERTRRAHFEAEEARQRSAFLADASRTLGASSLDYRTTLRTVARLAIPTLADYCIIDEVTEDGSLLRVETAHADPLKQHLVDRLRNLYVASLEHPAVQVLGTLKPLLLARLDDAELEAAAQDPEHLDIMRQLAPKSAIVVPLVARGRPLGTMFLVRTTSLPAYDQEDLGLAEELANRAALAADNARLYTESQMAVRVRDEFLSIASHELKTPLTPLELQIQSVLRRVPDIVSGKLPADWLQHRLGVIGRQSERLGRLIDELLDVSRIVAGKLRLELEPVDFGEVVRDSTSRFQGMDSMPHTSAQFKVDVANGVIGRWDRLRIEQVLMNLLSNAVKYGSDQPIEVRMTSDGVTASLEVVDRGIGISPTDQQRIFDRFERASSATHFAGLGLGLYITRQIVEAHGGTIGVSSDLGRGAAFTVHLPLAGPLSAEASDQLRIEH